MTTAFRFSILHDEVVKPDKVGTEALLSGHVGMLGLCALFPGLRETGENRTYLGMELVRRYGARPGGLDRTGHILLRGINEEDTTRGLKSHHS